MEQIVKLKSGMFMFIILLFFGTFQVLLTGGNFTCLDDSIAVIIPFLTFFCFFILIGFLVFEPLPSAQKVELISNLMIVLCSDKETVPVVNVGN